MSAQVTGLTRLLEGQKEAASAGSGRKENRRETWCPGAKGAAFYHMQPFASSMHPLGCAAQDCVPASMMVADGHA